MILEGVGLCKSYGGRQVLRDLDVLVRRGRCVGLLGPNGAGKTTCFNLLAGLLRPDGGRISLNGQDLTALPLHRRAQLGLGYLPQEPTAFQGLTVLENVLAVLEMRGVERLGRMARAEAILTRLGLAGLSAQRAGTLSGGERRRVEIARILALSPHFLLFDEPFAGLDPLTIREMREILLAMLDQNLGLLITDHNVQEALDLCDEVIVLVQGRLWARGTPQEVRQNPEIRRVYLG